MDKQCITIEPQIIQFGPDSRQLIKIINKTNDPIDNCFFCLFNVNKFQFSPDSFSLQPKQHKLITVTLKLKIHDNMGKEFAYLKSKAFNKRLTLINNRYDNSTSDKMRSIQEGVEEINTLTSRDYKQTQKSAYQKIISEKQAYILKLERKLQQNSFYGEQEKEQVLHITNKKYLDQIKDLHLQIAILSKEKEQLVIQNIEAHAKFKQYRIMVESDHRFAEMQSQAEEIKLLELQCQQFLRKIEEKQSQLEQSEYLYASKIDGIIKQGEKKLQLMEQKIQQQRKNTQIMLKNQTQQQTQRLEQKLSSIEAELTKKQKQIKSLRDKLEQEQNKTKEISAQTKRAIKLEQEKQMLTEQTKELKEKLSKMQNSYASLKEETIIFKNKLTDQDESSQKVHQYLEMALESCKNQNQILKKSKIDTENLLAEQSKSKRFYENKVQGLQQSVRDMIGQIKQMQEQLVKLNADKIGEKEQNHEKLMQLKSENVDLLQKIGANRRKEIQRNGELEDLKEMIAKYEEEQQRTKEKYHKLQEDYKQCLEEKDKMEKKIDKYRRQAKKSIKSIRENAKDELNKLEQQKNQLSKKVEELQISALNSEGKDPFNPEARHKTRTQYEEANKFGSTQQKQKYPMSLEGDHRRIGIRNQRRQLEESQANSQSALDMDKIYGELGQLRELRNYVNNQIRKLKPILGIDELRGCDQNMNVNGNSIFNVIGFFKELEHRLEDQFGSREKLATAQKQIQFLKGRLTQLEPIAKTLKSKQKKQQEISMTLKPEFDRNAIEYIRQEMKNQYKKLYDSLKLSEEKYEILRKKIYEEYRARIIQLISKKDRDEFTVNKIEAVLERFVEGLGNTSHKQAVLAKQIKLKQEARKQASLLKEKLTAVAKQAEANSNKKGNTCVREPLRVFEISNDQEWLDAVRMEAKVLTFEAQNARLLADKELYLFKWNQINEELKKCESDLELRDQEIQNLKKQVIEISKQYQLQKQKQQEEMNNLGKKFEKMQKMQKQISDLTIKQKENTHLRDELQQKRQMIKNLRERERMLEQLLDESKKNESTLKQRDRKQYMDQTRMQESLRDLRENNRQLRNQNSKLREQIDSLMEEANKKNAAMKRLKSQTQQYRIKNVKSEAESIEKLRLEIRELKQELKRNKQQSDKHKRKKEKEISEKLSEIERLKSQFSIEKSSLESIIRALADTIKSIYCSLDIIARKKGRIVADEPKIDSLISNPAEIKTNKIRQCFQEVIEALKS